MIETHLHADFISGHQELASAHRRAHLSGRAGGRAVSRTSRSATATRSASATASCAFWRLRATRLESISILVTDLERSPEPYAVLTGDTLFIGDVGRPDLSPNHTPQQLAGMLYDSLHKKLLTLPDGVEVYPAHGAGSLCGRQMSAERSSTIGQQRTANFALQAKSKEEFVRLLTAELPERPGYFALDAEINRSGPAPLADLPIPEALTARRGARAATGRRARARYAADRPVRRGAHSGRDPHRTLRTVRVVGRAPDRPGSRDRAGGGRSRCHAGSAHPTGAGRAWRTSPATWKTG